MYAAFHLILASTTQCLVSRSSKLSLQNPAEIHYNALDGGNGDDFATLARGRKALR
jgi:hypothetical protein